MKMKLLGVAGLLFAGFSLQAATGTLTMTQYGSVATSISPYTGTLTITTGSGTTTYTGIQLYCDDAADTAAPLNSAYNVDVTALSAGAAALIADTRFGAATGATLPGAANSLQNAGFSSLPTGTTLYQELAWLYTQMQSYSSNATQMAALQYAAWDLTSNSAAANATAQANAVPWLSLVRTLSAAGTLGSANGTSGALSYHSANFANWVIIDSTTAGGHVSGFGNQEFMAYFSQGGGTVTGQAAVPEPATFGLLGSALFFGAMVARRRRASK